MPVQPFARLNSGAALLTPASNSASIPGFTSICAISRTMATLPVVFLCCDLLLDRNTRLNPVVALARAGRNMRPAPRACRPTGPDNMLHKPGVTQNLARFVVATGWDDVPEPVRHDAKRALLNIVAVALAGC